MGLFDFFRKSSSSSPAKQRKIVLDELKVSFKGRPFYQLVAHHLKEQHYNARQFQMSVMGTIEILPRKAQSFAMDFIDRWNEQCYDKEFWQMDSSKILMMITDDARQILEVENVPADDETLFNMFQIVVLSYAYSAVDQPKMREFIGIKE
ncbi:MAG: hypothetical protein Q8M71_06280 [Thermodesulfovibrionales bacterium]|nr:hypothetical protein [Thermodesulfovibrionales bacterium]